MEFWFAVMEVEAVIEQDRSGHHQSLGTQGLGDDIGLERSRAVNDIQKQDNST